MTPFFFKKVQTKSGESSIMKLKWDLQEKAVEGYRVHILLPDLFELRVTCSSKLTHLFTYLLKQILDPYSTSMTTF